MKRGKSLAISAIHHKKIARRAFPRTRDETGNPVWPPILQSPKRQGVDITLRQYRSRSPERCTIGSVDVGNIDSFEELKKLDEQIQAVNELAALKPIYFRLNEIIQAFPGDFDIQFTGNEIKQHLMARGTLLKQQEATAPPPPAPPPPAMPAAEPASPPTRCCGYRGSATSRNAATTRDDCVDGAVGVVPSIPRVRLRSAGTAFAAGLLRGYSATGTGRPAAIAGDVFGDAVPAVIRFGGLQFAGTASAAPRCDG